MGVGKTPELGERRGDKEEDDREATAIVEPLHGDQTRGLQVNQHFRGVMTPRTNYDKGGDARR